MYINSMCILYILQLKLYYVHKHNVCTVYTFSSSVQPLCLTVLCTSAVNVYILQRQSIHQQYIYVCTALTAYYDEGTLHKNHWTNFTLVRSSFESPGREGSFKILPSTYSIRQKGVPITAESTKFIMRYVLKRCVSKITKSKD